MPIVHVALDIPRFQLFEYRADQIQNQDIGRLALVPFGNRTLTGVIIAISEHASLNASKIKSINKIFRSIPALPTDLLQLLRFCSDYYLYPLGATIFNCLPPQMRQVRSRMLEKQEHFALSGKARNIDIKTIYGRSAAKRLLLEAFKAHSILDRSQVAQISARGSYALKQLIAEGWVEQVAAFPTETTKAAESVLIHQYQLNNEQNEIVNRINDELSQYKAWLLFGVTGSGKTEVYFQLVKKILDNGRQVLFLVPEINLTPQFESLFRQRFSGTKIVSLHSGLNDSERLDNWLAAQNGDAQIILGTRLGVFTPLFSLGLIVIDEEHDSSFKQKEGLRYSARDVAIFRAKQNNIPIVLGSATPSMESYHKGTMGRFKLMKLRKRIQVSLPTVRLIDIRKQKLHEGISEELQTAIGEQLERGEQSLIFINRRGYAPVMMCEACAWVAGCHRCSARLVLHLKERSLRCHHCGYEQAVAKSCPTCGNQHLTTFGYGTQRITNVLAKMFPQARMLRVDRDTTSRKHDWQTMRDQIKNDEIDILVGTQIIAKGHDFPNLNLVAMLDADHSLFSADFRASERFFAQAMQVAGRAGRREVQGLVLVQTHFPDHPLFQLLQRHDYEAFARTTLEERAQAGFPPFVFQALLRAEASKLEAAIAFLKEAIELTKSIDNDVTVYDPVPATMVRIANRERAHLLVQSASRTRLRAFLHIWHAQLMQLSNAKVRWSLDVDPVDF